MAVESKDGVISKQKAEIDQLHAAVDEGSRSISGLNEKVSKSESQRKEVGSKLESAQGEISKLSRDLETKVYFVCSDYYRYTGGSLNSRVLQFADPPIRGLFFVT